jgi:hypothetical protein
MWIASRGAISRSSGRTMTVNRGSALARVAAREPRPHSIRRGDEARSQKTACSGGCVCAAVVVAVIGGAGHSAKNFLHQKSAHHAATAT